MTDLDYLAERVPEVREYQRLRSIGEDMWHDVDAALLAVQEYVKGLEDERDSYKEWEPVVHKVEKTLNDEIARLKESNEACQFNFGVEHDALVKAEARVKHLEAEVDRLKCCGNCIRTAPLFGNNPACVARGDGTLIHVSNHDSCHFTPSRWTRKEDHE